MKKCRKTTKKKTTKNKKQTNEEARTPKAPARLALPHFVSVFYRVLLGFSHLLLGKGRGGFQGF